MNVIYIIYRCVFALFTYFSTVSTFSNVSPAPSPPHAPLVVGHVHSKMVETTCIQFNTSVRPYNIIKVSHKALICQGALDKSAISEVSPSACTIPPWRVIRSCNCAHDICNHSRIPSGNQKASLKARLLSFFWWPLSPITCNETFNTIRQSLPRPLKFQLVSRSPANGRVFVIQYGIEEMIHRPVK